MFCTFELLNNSNTVSRCGMPVCMHDRLCKVYMYVTSTRTDRLSNAVHDRWFVEHVTVHDVNIRMIRVQARLKLI